MMVSSVIIYSVPQRHDLLGQRTQYTHPNGTRTEYDYDNWHRLVGIYHKHATNNYMLDSFEYTLDDGNAITRIDHAGKYRDRLRIKLIIAVFCAILLP